MNTAAAGYRSAFRPGLRSDRPDHRDLSCLRLSMRTPGVEARPLPNMTGWREFNEVFLTTGATTDPWALARGCALQDWTAPTTPAEQGT